MYHVAYDKQKWLLSGYHRDTDSKLIKAIVLGLLETVCKLGLSVNLEYFRTKEEYDLVRALAQEYGYELHVFELTAPYAVLLARFHERVENAKEKGSKISMTTDEVFNENYQKGYFVPEGTLSFDTTKVSEEEIVSKILTFF